MNKQKSSKGIFKLTFVLFLFSVTRIFAQPWQCIIYGDTRSHDNDHRQVLQAIMNNTPNYKFIINVGDVVSDGTVKSLWDTWQRACDDVLGGTGQDQTPPKYMAVPGNHDNTETSSGLANWNTYLPGQKNLYGNDGKYFYFDYEDARFILLDSDKSPIDGPQFTMMKNAIENNPQKWLILVWHHPIFDFGPKHYEQEIHQTWGVPLYQNGCDLIFNGHAHYYVRTKKLLLNGQKNPPLDSLKGIPQIVTGNGGAPLYSVNPNEDGNGYMVAKYIAQYGYTELTFSGDTLRLRHILKDGTVFDQTYYTPNPKPSQSAVRFPEGTQPAHFQLFQNYPNPFNASTSIRFHLRQSCPVTLNIFNLNGEIVQTLIDGNYSPGNYQIIFNAENVHGAPVASGIYFYQLKAGTEIRNRKMNLLR
ncbi:MAG: T9SS type A sorting domain-containing protein [Calditrichaeota bacterium]|nr:T9SS type A sorting domain-containing protein [Calditrichota bacterium]